MEMEMGVFVEGDWVTLFYFLVFWLCGGEDDKV